MFPTCSSPEAVIKRFEGRYHAVDSRGVAEYIKALVATNAIAEYLPDEQSGKPASLPTLVLIYFSYLLMTICMHYLWFCLQTRAALILLLGSRWNFKHFNTTDLHLVNISFNHAG